jgi:hypothetical protein
MIKDIDRQKHDMKARGSKLIELEPIIPLAKQLQGMKVDITNFMPWAGYVREYVMTNNTDLTTAAYRKKSKNIQTT